MARVPDPRRGVREAPRRLPPTGATAQDDVGTCSGLFWPLNSFIGGPDGALKHRHRCSVGPVLVDGLETEEVWKPKKGPVLCVQEGFCCWRLPAKSKIAGKRKAFVVGVFPPKLLANVPLYSCTVAIRCDNRLRCPLPARYGTHPETGLSTQRGFLCAQTSAQIPSLDRALAALAVPARLFVRCLPAAAPLSAASPKKRTSRR